jgi:hypothetical protein
MHCATVHGEYKASVVSDWMNANARGPDWTSAWVRCVVMVEVVDVVEVVLVVVEEEEEEVVVVVDGDG